MYGRSDVFRARTGGELMSQSTTDAWPRMAVVVGAGTMGAGIAQVLALGGVDATLVDVELAAAEAGRERIVALAARFAERGLLAADAAERVAAHVRVAASLEAAVGESDLVLEAVTEDPVVKHAIYTRIEAAAPHDAIVATNTSAIPIAQLAASFQRPQRFFGAHWFNPAQWVPCVELIPGPATDPAHIERLAQLLRRLGKEPTAVGDSAGFVANRIQFAMFREAAAVVAEGVAGPAEVDAIVRASFGFRLPFFGPFQIADMAGLDVYSGAYAALAQAHGPERAAPPAVERLVADGRLGVKQGGGFLPAPSADELAELIERRDAAYASLSRLLEQES
jgi:3-hydroxybutyryl-CoA dehydrogenase